MPNFLFSTFVILICISEISLIFNFKSSLEIIKKQPNEEGSNYILGLHFKQIGDMGKAIEVWEKTLNNLKANSPWRQILKEELIKIKS